jgi:16S rRNA processing protein RimM
LSEWVTLARVDRSRGNRGEVAATCFTSGPERFAGLEVVLVGPDGPLGGGRRFAVENAWSHQGRLILKFQGVGSISEAEALRGLDVCLPIAERAPLAEGEYYLTDLVGCDVVDGSGARIGVVDGWQETDGAPRLLEVRGARGELLVPLVPAICRRIDPAARRIEVDLPEGLAELNS